MQRITAFEEKVSLLFDAIHFMFEERLFIKYFLFKKNKTPTISEIFRQYFFRFIRKWNIIS